jgi:peptide/nickel transport system substrate-binding protein
LLGVSLVAVAGGSTEPAPAESSAAAAMPAGRFSEAPMLAELVAAGELPPVDERLPDAPPVLDAPEIGQYGGTARVFAINPRPWNDLMEQPERGRYLLQFAAGGTITGDMVESYEFNADKSSITFYLRSGMRWSDGAPFTVDDIIFRFEDMHWMEEVQSSNVYPEVKRLVKVDDYTVRMEADAPNPGVTLKMAMWQGGNWTAFAPKHYLSQWHIRYNSDADAKAKEEGFDNWWEAMGSHAGYPIFLKDADSPTLHPWRPVELASTRKIFERNAYYWRVDAAGNQLPYIDRVVSNVVEPEVYTLKIISGEADIAHTRTNFADYALFKENEEAGGYLVTPIPGLHAATVGVALNFNHPEEWRAQLYQDVRFRRALSLAINREEVNEAVFFGLATPRQSAPIPASSYYKPEWEQGYAAYQPDQANALLDEIGMTMRDRDGFRHAPGGERLQIVLEFPQVTLGVESLELIKEYWQEIGIDVLLKPLEDGLFFDRRLVNEHDARAMPIEGEEIADFNQGAHYHSCFRSQMLGSSRWRACGADFDWGFAWGEWIAAHNAIEAGDKTLADFDGSMPGTEPPDVIKELDAWTRRWVNTEFGSAEYVELAQKIYDLQAENLWVIGVVGMAPQPYITKNNIGNVPTAYTPGMEWPGSLAYFAEQLFFRQ